MEDRIIGNQSAPCRSSRSCAVLSTGARAWQVGAKKFFFGGGGHIASDTYIRKTPGHSLTQGAIFLMGAPALAVRNDIMS